MLSAELKNIYKLQFQSKSIDMRIKHIQSLPSLLYHFLFLINTIVITKKKRTLRVAAGAGEI